MTPPRPSADKISEPLFPSDRYLRIARRREDLSQRELAELAGVSQSLVARIERDPKTARAEDVAHLLAATKLSLIVIDDDDREVPPEPARIADLRNVGGRRFPPHLDVRPGIEGWWGDRYWSRRERPPPAYTFDRARWRRELHRMWLASHYGIDPG